MRPPFSALFCVLVSALLLTLAWYWNLSIFVFVGFAPLLLLEEHYRRAGERKKLFMASYLAFLLWNIGVTWWIFCVEFGKGGAVLAWVANALLMAIVFLIYSRFRVHFPGSRGAWLIVPIWLAFEHLHTLWDLAWTWLTLGNAFSANHYWIQWYELTGTSGGSLWALAGNVVAYRALVHPKPLRLMSKPVLRLAMLIVTPIVVSYFIYLVRLLEKPQPDASVNIVVVQPNIDPYNEKFDVDFREQFGKMLSMVRDSISDNTDYLVLPETFISPFGAGLNEKSITMAEEIRWFRDSLLTRYPEMKIVAGGNTYVIYDDAATPTVRYDKHAGIYYDVFNTALLIDSARVGIYHKSKLVPGVEKMPFPTLFKPLESLAIDMGGTVGSLGTQNSRDVFLDTVKHTGVAPVICYESVFADYVTEYIRNGASLIFIITNDGWWDDTPGYHQHLRYAKLRAIETRREIARSANTGTSCFIDRFGNIAKPTPWWEEAVITGVLKKNDALTFFARYGDLLSYMSVVFTLLLFVWILFSRWPWKLMKLRSAAADKKP